MSDFFVDLLPDDARKIFRRRVHFRIVKLGAVLTLTVTTGVVFKSFVELRKAQAEHEVIVALRDRSSKIDELVSKSANERTILRSEIAADAMLRSPVNTSAIIATVSHLLPSGSWLESMRVVLEEQKNGKTPSTNRPIYVVMMNGIAPNAQSVQDFAAELRKTPPFAAVTVLEQRAAPKTGGGSEQQFIMRVRIDPTAAESAVNNSNPSWTQTVAVQSQATNEGSPR